MSPGVSRRGREHVWRAADDILRLRALYGVRTDSALAKALGVGSSAVSGWRRRGVPAAYLLALRESSEGCGPRGDAKTLEERDGAQPSRMVRTARMLTGAIGGAAFDAVSRTQSPEELGAALSVSSLFHSVVLGLVYHALQRENAIADTEVREELGR